MSRWRQLWKDVLLTGTGVVVILLQATVYEAHPNGLLIGVGLAFTVPSTWDHIRALIPSAGGSSSESSEGHGPSPDSPSREGTGE